MSINRELKRIKHIYSNKIVETKAKADFNRTINILGKLYGPFIKGNSYKMEFWIAKVFIMNDILDLNEKESYNVKKIQKIAFTEGRSTEISEVDPFLFTAVKENLDIIAHKTSMGNKAFKSTYSNFQDLIAVRHRKILSLSQTRQSMITKQNLTDEEKILMKNLTNNFSEWKGFYLYINTKKPKKEE